MINLKSNYLVTGSSGFLGYHFVNFLANNKIKAIGIYNLHSPTYTKSVTFIKCNLLNLKDVLNLPKTRIIVHFAARVSGKNKVTTNEIITRNLVKYCNLHKAKLIFISSSQVLYPIENSYIISKKRNEEYIKRNCRDYIIVRPAAPYGEEITKFKVYRKQPLHILSRATRFPIVPIIGSGLNTRQPLHIKDLNKFIFLVSISRKSNHKTYNIGGPKVLTYNQIVDTILRVKKRRAIKVYIPISIAKILARFLSFTDSENIVASTISEKVENNWLSDFYLRLTSFEVGCRSLP